MTEGTALRAALPDALTDTLPDALPDALTARIVSGERLAIRWLETRVQEELAIYPRLCRIAHGILEEGLSGGVITPGQTTTDDLACWLRARVSDLGLEPWRTAARAAAVSRALPYSLAVPMLIDALETWVARAQAGQRVTRLQYDISRELAERSGLELGLRADRWARVR